MASLKTKPNKKPVFGDPALELVYRSWQRNRERAPELALKVVEAYAQAHRLSVRDLLRRFAEAEAREASQAPQAAPEVLGGPSGEGAGTALPPLASEASTALQGPEEGPRQARPGRDSRRATIYRRPPRGGYLGTTPRGGLSVIRGFRRSRRPVIQ
jgi:hypothetical protein